MLNSMLYCVWKMFQSCKNKFRIEILIQQSNSKLKLRNWLWNAHYSWRAKMNCFSWLSGWRSFFNSTLNLNLNLKCNIEFQNWNFRSNVASTRECQTYRLLLNFSLRLELHSKSTFRAGIEKHLWQDVLRMWRSAVAEAVHWIQELFSSEF